MRWRERNREMERLKWERDFFFFFIYVLLDDRAGRVSTRPKTQYPLSIRNPNKKNKINCIRPYICSRAGGRTNRSAGFIWRVEFHGFFPTPTTCFYKWFFFGFRVCYSLFSFILAAIFFVLYQEIRHETSKLFCWIIKRKRL